jgi:hypothetical protein
MTAKKQIRARASPAALAAGRLPIMLVDGYPQHVQHDRRRRDVGISAGLSLLAAKRFV